MDAAERFELMVRVDEMKSIERKQRDPDLILCFDPQETLSYFRSRGWGFVDDMVVNERAVSKGESDG